MPVIKVMQYDEDAQEAIVDIQTSLNELASMSTVSLIAFCPSFFTFEVHRKISLFGFLVTNIVFENEMQAPHKTNCGYFSYRLCARVLDPQSRHVQLGDIDIVLDCPIPKDISSGSYISFDVMRLDWQC